MVKVAVCGAITLEEGDVESSIRRCAANESAECALDGYANPLDLIDACSKALLEAPYDLVVCAVDLAGVSGVQAVSELRELHTASDDLRLVLCSSSPDHAYDAQALGVDGYLTEPIDLADFDRVIGRLLREIIALRSESVLVRCRDRMRRISFFRLSYAETADHDQVLHHIGEDKTCVTRCSSRDLFAMLEHDGRFFKVGSSYIVNLDFVKRFDSKTGVAELTDGIEIPIPVRTRRPFEQALRDRGEVAV